MTTPIYKARPSRGEQLSQGITRGLEMGSQLVQQNAKKQQELDAYKQMGINPSVANLPENAKAEYFKHVFANENKTKEAGDKLQSNRKQLYGVGQSRGLEGNELENFVNTYQENVALGEKVTKPKNEPKPALTEKEVPKHISKTIKKILADNPKASSDELRISMDEAGIPPVYSNPYTENRRKTEETATKQEQDKLKELRHETLPFRTGIANKAQSAAASIQNKQDLINIIERGNINDPTYAIFAEALPLDLGMRLLSNDSIEYKAALVDNYKDLSTLFPGAIRVKEIEIYDDKAANLYLTDDQKKAILNSRINASRADIIRAEVAQELENEPLGVLQFQAELEKRAKPRLDALAKSIWEEQKAIIDAAERRKDIPLDYNIPDDKKIVDAILQEANGDKVKAREIAKNKGYKF